MLGLQTAFPKHTPIINKKLITVIGEPFTLVGSIQDLKTGGRSLVDSWHSKYSFWELMIIIVQDSFLSPRCPFFQWFNVGKQPVAWKEYCVEYRSKEIQESMGWCTGYCNVTEILLKMTWKKHTKRLSEDDMSCPRDLDLWSWPWVHLNKCFKWHIYSWWRTIVKIYNWNPSKIVGVLVRTKLWPSRVTLTLGIPERMFQMAHLNVMENNWVKIFWNLSTTVEVTVRTNSDRRTHRHMHIHQTVIVTTVSCSLQADLTIIIQWLLLLEITN